MNKLQKILTSITPEYEYRVKFAMEPTKDDMAKISARLTDRYDAVEIGPLTKLIFQDRPLDFYELDCGEVWMFDFTCNRGVQTEVLRYEIGNQLKWTEANIKVRGKEEPIEIELEEEQDIDFDEYETALGQPFGQSEPDAAELAGQERADKAVEDGLENLRKVKTNDKFAKYLSAGFNTKKD